MIPKSGQQEKWQLIVDLSSPEGTSINAENEPELCSLRYLRLDEVILQIAKLGTGTQLAKRDIEGTYQMIPVHPGDRPLLGIQWAGGDILRHKITCTIWREVSTKDFLGGSRHTGMVILEAWSKLGRSLPGRLHYPKSTRVIDLQG